MLPEASKDSTKDKLSVSSRIILWPSCRSNQRGCSRLCVLCFFANLIFSVFANEAKCAQKSGPYSNSASAKISTTCFTIFCARFRSFEAATAQWSKGPTTPAPNPVSPQHVLSELSFRFPSQPLEMVYLASRGLLPPVELPARVFVSKYFFDKSNRSSDNYPFVDLPTHMPSLCIELARLKVILQQMPMRWSFESINKFKAPPFKSIYDDIKTLKAAWNL